jgi:hypothetical protein
VDALALGYGDRMEHITPEARRRRLLRRHLLAPAARSGDLGSAAEAMIGLHSSDPATVFLAARARMVDPTVDSIERQLYDEPVGLRMHGMRRTMFVQALPVAPVVQSAVTWSVAARERQRTLAFLLDAGIADGAAWLEALASESMAALAARGEATLIELGEDVPALRRKIRLAVGKPYEADVAIGTRVLPMLAMEGRIARGRPLGTWISSQYRWLPIERVVPGGLGDIPAPDARADLVRRWLRTFGPGTLRDLRWWSGLTAADVRRALESNAAVEVDLGDGTIGWVLPDDRDVDQRDDGDPFATFLPGLDPTVMGWADRDFYLGAYRSRLFDTNGNAGPTVWWDGRIVGGWGQRADGEVAWQLLEDVGADGRAAIEGEAERLQAWLGGVRITPRFRSPIDRAIRGDG